MSHFSRMHPPKAASNKPTQQSTTGTQKSQHAPILLLCDFCERDGPTIVFSTTVRTYEMASSQDDLLGMIQDVVEQKKGELVEEVERELGVEAEEKHDAEVDEEKDANLEENGTKVTTTESSASENGTQNPTQNGTNGTSTTPEKNLSDEEPPTRRRKRKLNFSTQVQQNGKPNTPKPSTPSALAFGSPNKDRTSPQSFRSQTQQFIFNSHLALPFKKPETVARLNQVCLRSLSGEHVGPGKEGACLFGDDVQGYTFSYVFKIKDFKARGHTRWMSFCLISMNLVDLAMNWSFLSRAIRNWIRDIKNASNAVFNEEQRDSEREAEALRLMGKDPLSNQMGAFGRSIGGDYHDGSHGAAGGTPSSFAATHTNRMSSRHEMLRRIGFRSTKRSREKLRGLSDLLRAHNFFELLHVNVCVILKAFLTRLVRLDSTDRCNSCGSIRGSALPSEDKFSFLHFYNQLKSIDDDYRKITECILYNMLVGNQLVLRGDNVDCLSEIIEACMVLVPQESIMFPKNEHNKYCPTYQANFLVLHSSVSLLQGHTSLIDPESALLLDIQAHFDENRWPQITSVVATSALQGQLENIPRTQMVSQVLKLLSSSTSPNGFHSRLNLLKQQCVTRAKVLVQLYMTVQNAAAIKEHEATFLNMFSYTQNDIRVLRNFSTGQRHKKRG